VSAFTGAERAALCQAGSCEAVMSSWVRAMAPLGARGLVICGPRLHGRSQAGNTQAWAAFPESLAASTGEVAAPPFGSAAARADTEHVGFGVIPAGAATMRNAGMKAYVQVRAGVMAAPFKLVCLLQQEVSQAVAFQIGAELYNLWPAVHQRLLAEKVNLSPRTRAILGLIAGEGLTAEEVAGRMGIGERTVTHHIALAKQKLGVHKKAREPVIALAIALGLI